MIRQLLCVAAALAALGCPGCGTPATAQGVADPAGFERIPPGEAEAIAEIVALLSQFMEREYPAAKRPALRDAHAKAHGCVHAEFEVPELEPELRVGVFREPRSYPAWIRFSNGSEARQPDAAADGRGMAIKLMGVAGPKLLQGDVEKQTQDFVMINHPVFFVDTAASYLDFTRRQHSGGLFGYFARHWRGAFIVFSATRREVVSPLATRYWSMSPYLYGDRAMKYSARPCEVAEGEYTASDSPGFLADNMQRQLETREGCFEFAVQLRSDPERMPIEDPTVEWSEVDAPFVKVADIRIPKQQFRSEEQQRFCEDLSLTPWHSVPEHRPLGGINRLRKAVYETSSKLRHELNAAPRVEPRVAELSARE